MLHKLKIGFCLISLRFVFTWQVFFFKVQISLLLSVITSIKHKAFLNIHGLNSVRRIFVGHQPGSR